MHIQSAGQKNNTNFGINFINKPHWNKELLKTLEESKLVKDIDNKYPDAFVKYSKLNIADMDLANNEPCYLSSLIFGLEKNKISTLNINSHTSEGANRALKTYVISIPLENLEKKAKANVEAQKYFVEITPIKKESSETKTNIISRFISNLFNKQ